MVFAETVKRREFFLDILKTPQTTERSDVNLKPIAETVKRREFFLDILKTPQTTERSDVNLKPILPVKLSF